MFAARGIAVSLSVFVMVYCVLSLAVSASWRSVWQHLSHQRARRDADLLFALRMLPFLTACVITAVFTIPSFLLLEPRSIDERVGAIPMGLALVGVAFGIYGVANAGVALRRAAKVIANWTREARAVDCSISVPVFRIARNIPAMTAAGIVRSTVLLSVAAESALTRSELQIALNHELAHIRRWDNLKKLLFRLVPFPAMAAIESAWLEAAEMAADDAAVSAAAEALDLASALIKLSRFGPVEPAVDLTAALVHTPAEAMNARIARLVAWRGVPAPHAWSIWYGLCAAAATVTLFSVAYSQLLIHVHTATEWLVR